MELTPGDKILIGLIFFHALIFNALTGIASKNPITILLVAVNIWFIISLGFKLLTPAKVPVKTSDLKPRDRDSNERE